MIDIEVFKILEGIALRKVRQSVKLSKYRLGKLLNFEAKRISLWESGQVDMRMYSVYQLCEAMGVPYSELSRVLESLITEFESTGVMPEISDDADAEGD